MKSDNSLKAREGRPPLIPLAKYTSNDIVVNEVESSNLPVRKIIRERIYELQETLEATVESKLMPKEMGILKHYFIPGVYARELFIPAGTVMVSHLHKFPRLCIISKGDVTFTTEYGTQRVRAPYTAEFKPGSKVALFTHADTVWTAITRTDLTSVKDIEEEILAKDHDEYDTFCKENNLGLGEE